MQIIPDTPGSILEALDCLKSGGIVAHATETCYGLACDLANPKAVEKLFAIKKRSAEFPVSALFPSVDEAKKYVEWNPAAEELAAKYLPGPLTIILPIRRDTPQKIFPVPSTPVSSRQYTSVQSPVHPTLGIRISSHPVAMELAKCFGHPLSTTSANVHGFPSPYDIDDIKRQFAWQSPLPDLLIDSGPLPHALPSSIIRISDGRIEMVRRGPLIF